MPQQGLQKVRNLKKLKKIEKKFEKENGKKNF